MEQIIHFDASLSMPLREKDNQFIKIQELIEMKKNLLFEKQQKLNQMRSQNHFLDSIKQDYLHYYNYIQQQKNEQIKALELLNEYIEDLTFSGKLTKNNIEDARQEQQNILKEVKYIKKKLDDIISNTQDLQIKLNK